METPDQILKRAARKLLPPALLLLTASWAGAATFHTGKLSVWTHYSMDEYTKNRQVYDDDVKMMENAIPLLSQRFGSTLPTVTVNIVKGDCKEVPTSSNNQITMESGCFFAPYSLYGRHALLFYIVAIGTGNVSGGWHLDFLRPFSEMVLLELAREVLGAAPADSLTASSQQAKTPAFATLRALKDELGWSFFQSFFSQVKTDGLHWNEIGSDSSQTLMSYTAAYLSIAAGKKLAVRLRDGGVRMVDPFETMRVLTARARLSAAVAKKRYTSDAWAAFEKGQYDKVKDLIRNQ